MKQSINFMYDNIHSQDMGVFIAWDKDGLFEENFLPERKIVEKKIANREKPYFQRVEHEPLSFTLQIAIEDWESDDTLRKIARWLFQPYYKPLVFESNPNRVFNAIFEGDASLIHNGAREGYIEIDIRCDSPYSYSHENIYSPTQYRDSNVGHALHDDASTFNTGTHYNTKTTSNGLTIDSVVTTWGLVYATSEHWGGVI